MARNRDTRRQTRWWRWAWLGLAVYAALSLADYVLTLIALTTGRAGLSPAPTRPYESNTIAVWLLTHEGAVSVLVYKGIPVVLFALLLLVIRPMWTQYAWLRAVTWGLLGASIAWQVSGVYSVVNVLIWK